MHRSCIYHIIVELAIIFGLPNCLDTMATQETTTCGDSPCGYGEYYKCFCMNCPPGTFNKYAMHRNGSCEPYSLPPHPGCVLTENGTLMSDLNWTCPELNPTTKSSLMPVYNTTTVTRQQLQDEPTVQTLVLVIIIIAAAIFVLIILLIIYCIWKQGRQQRPDLNDASVSFLMKKL